MRQIVIGGFGGSEKMALRQGPDPEPGEAQVLIAVRFSGVNFADIVMRMGVYPGGPRPPFVPGFEIAGQVEKAGPGAQRKAGERVLAMLPSGGYADRVVVADSQAVPLPHGMSLEEAAALPVNYLTAWEMIMRVAHLRKGERILIHTAGGGVGVAATQIARSLGAEILGTASSSKHEFLRSQGVDHAIDYHTSDFETQVHRITRASGDPGVDVVLDPLGGRATRKNYRLLRTGGRLIVFGFSRAVTGERRSLAALPELAAMPRFHPLGMMRANTTVSGFHLGRINNPERLREDLVALFDLYARGAIRPVVGRVFPLEEAAQAHRFIQQRANIGKVLLDCAGP
jgi:NADPH:quinone reductase-like Zn-dependent oxidoreductase